jgi:hypothetical protein
MEHVTGGGRKIRLSYKYVINTVMCLKTLHISFEIVNDLHPFCSESHVTMAVVIIQKMSVFLRSHNNNTPTTTQEANTCFQSSRVCA